MRTLLIGLLATVCLGFAADTSSKLSYSQNAVPAVTFNPQGTWTITGIAGKSELPLLPRVRERRFLNSQISINGTRVAFSNAKSMSWREPFPTPIIGQETYDTQSKEFWLDFRSDPKELNLPRYVSAVMLEVGTILGTQAGQALFEFDGVWFTLKKSGGDNSRTL